MPFRVGQLVSGQSHTNDSFQIMEKKNVEIQIIPKPIKNKSTKIEKPCRKNEIKSGEKLTIIQEKHTQGKLALEGINHLHFILQVGDKRMESRSPI